jgi:lysophospholipase L1-like esterase
MPDLPVHQTTIVPAFRASRLLRQWLPGACIAGLAAVQGAEWKFDFGKGPAPEGFTRVPPETAYDPAKRFGFLTGAGGGGPKVFAADLEEGNHEVTVRFGDPERATRTTIKAETRRLMIEDVATEPGRFETRTFTINVRQPAIRTGGVVALNARESGPPLVPHWDQLLTLEFNGPAPGVAALSIRPAPAATTVFLAGDSTVTDQRDEPYAGWGQMLPRFFSGGIAVSNHAESGLALHSFERQQRLRKILGMMKEGDYLFIQFGHNDQKDKSPGSGPFTTYQANLGKFVDAARAKGGIPVLLTPMERRRWEGDQPGVTLAEYAEAVRQVGIERKVPVIDLHAMSLEFYTALGPERSEKAFVFYPANAFGQSGELKDNTHHNNYGGYELARCVVAGIRLRVPALAERLAKDVGAFDPRHPQPPEQFSLPLSRIPRHTVTPAGS